MIQRKQEGYKLIRLFTCLPILLISQWTQAKDCVVLLHGLGRSAHAMKHMEAGLTDADYSVINTGYPSREKSIRLLASVVGDGIQACRILKAKHIHFVTHSLGGILVRTYFQNHAVPEAQRVVMLGPPNHGSEIVDRYKNKRWFQRITGPAGQELGTDMQSMPNTLQPIALEIGVIAGTKNMDPWFSHIVPAPSDGKVSVASTQLAEMKDFMTLPHSHTWIADADDTIAQTLYFLEHGSFRH